MRHTAKPGLSGLAQVNGRNAIKWEDKLDWDVYIEGDAQFERDYYLEYSNKFQEFSFISGTLLIKARDRWGNSIEIDITNES